MADNISSPNVTISVNKIEKVNLKSKSVQKKQCIKC